MNWTEEQKQVIESRGRNLLVSAAAGSGKTAVLVEHILNRISDPSEHININELLVVTFTRAAAAEMRERLQTKLTVRLEEEPDNRHLTRQLPLLPQAQICTIDSFCQWMVKNYFYELDLDPDFRIVDEGENRLLREEILDTLMEDSFQEADEAFLHLAGAFGSVRGDRAVRDLVLSLSDFAESAPWPTQWLSELRTGLQQGDPDGSSAWRRELFGNLQQRLGALAASCERALRLAEESEGLDRYADMFRADLQQLTALRDAASLNGLIALLGSVSFVRKPVIPKKAVYDAAVKEVLSSRRDRLKKQLQSISGRYAIDPDADAEYETAAAADCCALIDLTLAFNERYRKEKERRSLAAFSDVEHWALSLLVRRKDGVPVPTALAEELGRNFREIIIDEYQDSNLVQEIILQSLSGERRGEPNRFLVGDVKQSIYKFRMAKPELFMEKYRSYEYGKDSFPGRKIDLGRNFRSRRAVLAAVNELFTRLMGEELGGIRYDEHAALYPGAEYPGADAPVELMLTEASGEDEDSKETEARQIAARIRELTGPDSDFRLWDAGEGKWRRAEYRDIVILLRTMEGWAETFSQVLSREGIPASAQLRSGYFSAREVQVLLNFLRVLDNPLSDIPLASVLFSPLGGFSSEEAAQITAGMSADTLWDRLRQGAALGRSREKWATFEERIRRYRREASLRPIHEILEELLTETDYRLILAAQPDGPVRTANVEMLLTRAMSFEETSYHGIFSFLRYMDQLNRYEVDFGEAQVLSEQENLVRITSIHRSKGLEYPVVFAAGLAKRFNRSDAASAMLMHEELGLACDYIDTEEGIRYPLLKKKAVADRMEREMKAEELRLLYVAMTRAKEKLILSAACADPAAETEKWQLAAEGEGTPFSPAALLEANRFLDWILLAGAGSEESSIQRQIVSAPEQALKEQEAAVNDLARKEGIRSLLHSGERKENIWRRVLDFRYPQEAVVYEKTAYSVSELKHRAAEEALRETAGAAAKDALPERSGAAAGEKARRETALWAERADGTPNPGALRGTAYHCALEHIPAADGADASLLAGHLDRLVHEEILTRSERDMIDDARLLAYYRSPLGQLAARAEAAGRLHREQPFIMRIPLADVLPDGRADAAAEGEWVLLQGIIDACAETEEGTWILWDYKTDAVSEADGEERLRLLYTEQLHRYRDALEQAKGQRVTEMWLYSFALGRAVRVF